jgi:hypothetical protein
MTKHDVASPNNAVQLFLCSVANKRENDEQHNDYNVVILLTAYVQL